MSSQDMKEIGERIKQVRLRKGMDQQTLATLLNMTNSAHISRVENAKYKTVSEDMLERIGAVLGVTASYLRFGNTLPDDLRPSYVSEKVWGILQDREKAQQLNILIETLSELKKREP